MFCKDCGAQMRDGAVFCPKCGAKAVESGQLRVDSGQFKQAAAPPVPAPRPQQYQAGAKAVESGQLRVDSGQFKQAAVPPVPAPRPQQYQVTAQATPPKPPVRAEYPDQRLSQPFQDNRRPPKEPVRGDGMQAFVQQPPTYPPAPPKKKMSTVLIALFIAIPLLIGVVIGAYFMFSGKGGSPEDNPGVSSSLIPKQNGELPAQNQELPAVSYSYQDKQPEAVIEFTAVDTVFPSNYRSLESLVTFTGYCEYGEMDVMVEVEVPGFTQNYKQKVTLGRQVAKLRIIPPLITGSIDLNSEKMAQLIYSVTEIETGRVLEQESQGLKLYSKFDIIWGDEEDWDAYTDDILAWMTPDAPEVLELKRDAIDYLSYISDGSLNMMVGYQDTGLFDSYAGNTWAQALAIQGAMSDITQVRYNMAPFTMDSNQRVKMPADTLNSRSGICVETSLVMASALQSAGMHAMLIFPPGHCQVALEVWPDTGDYFLIETTILPMPQNSDGWDAVVRYLDKDEWYKYIGDSPCYVVDCDLGAKLGIRAISN